MMLITALMVKPTENLLGIQPRAPEAQTDIHPVQYVAKASPPGAVRRGAPFIYGNQEGHHKPEIMLRPLAEGRIRKRNLLRPSYAQTLARYVRRASSSLSPGRITMIGACVNVLLSGFKVGVGMMASSGALIADGWHSLSDLVSDALCWVSVQLGAHGYERLEHVCTLGIAAILLATGIAMTVHSGSVLLPVVRGTAGAAGAAAVGAAPALSSTPHRAHLDVAALCVAIASVLSKELLFSISHAVGVRCRSPSLIANAFHHRSDALSSVVAVVGIFGVMCGCRWIDSLAATAVGLMVARMGSEVACESFAAIVEAHESDAKSRRTAPSSLAATAPA